MPQQHVSNYKVNFFEQSYLTIKQFVIRNNLMQPGTCGTLAAEFENEYSPQEKLEHLQRISVHYWNYITKQMIKLKQLKLIDTENNSNESKNFGSVSFSSNAAANDSSVMPNTRSSFSPLSNRRAYEAKYYFEFEEAVSESASRLEDGYDLCDETGAELEDKTCDQLDEDELTIQSGLLNLILDCIEPHEVYDVHQVSIRLKEAVLLFNTMNQNLEEKYKIDLNYYHLQVYVFQYENLLRNFLIIICSKLLESCAKR